MTDLGKRCGSSRFEIGYFYLERTAECPNEGDVVLPTFSVTLVRALLPDSRRLSLRPPWRL